ncbi:S8 family serine peptidase [Rhizohabitans arisaemae]|uniref:S8 family serine peptidase n=1 Tax=Rhizohabitans arisaemae TaxID=2720610 RepID=UPI0024B2340B|nr:S8 family serine peptidase [Rhizohabitans arisaemae]
MRLRAGIAALATLLTAGVVTTPPPSAHAEPGNPGVADGPRRSADAPKHGDVTLITGDRVTVLPGPKDGPPPARITPGEGRAVTFTQRWRDGHLHVIPSDALPLIGRGLLDERLFDVTQLLAWGYGDAHRDDIPVIVQSDATAATPRLTAAEGTGSFPGLGLSAARLPKKQTAATWESLGTSVTAKSLAGGVTKLWLDGKRTPVLDRSVPRIGAPTAWSEGLTGDGVTVAVLDSGYDPAHPDLRDAVVQARNFDPDSPDAYDRYGHGTHVASVVAGSGQASDGRHKGVAPGARLAIGKLGDRSFTDSVLLAGMTWAAGEVKAKVVNMSLGGPDGPEIDPVEHAVNTLTAQHGTLFVVAAGNGGPRSISSPGSADAALTVGAVDPDDRLAGFSSTGPRNWDKAVKPDITAPGVDITAAAAAGTAPGPYVAYRGTSMAAPHVAGAAAILAQRHPTWTAGQLKAALVGSAVPSVGAGAFEQGAGRVDVARAIAQPVVAEPGTLSTTLPWPQTGGPVAKTVVYRNSGAAPLALDLTLEGSLPQGLAEVSTRQVTVPAGGEAPVTLTLNPAGVPTGAYAGVIVARSGQTTVRTPLGVHVEPESHDQRIEVIGPDGRPGSAFITIYNLVTDESERILVAGGRATARLPVGEWNAFGEIFTDSGLDSTLLHLPLRVTPGDAPLVLDARQAREVRFSVDEPTAVRDENLAVTIANRQGDKTWSQVMMIYNPGLRAKISVLPSRQPGVGLSLRTVWHKRGANPSPYRYDLVQHHRGGLPADPTLAARTAELAKVTAVYRSTAPDDRTADIGVQATAPGEPSSFSFPEAVPVPGTLIHYRVPGDGIVWSSWLSHEDGHTIEDAGRTVRRRNYTEPWNNAVIGPALRAGESIRTGDELRYTASSLFTDGTPGRYGDDASLTGTVVLAKDGLTLGRAEFTECHRWFPDNTCTVTAQLPPGGGVYTLTTTAHRNPAVSALSTRIEAAWTFTSARTATATPLPLAIVRHIALGLDIANRAKHGTRTPIALRVERAPGAAAAKVTSLRVEASSDDGATWRPIPVVPFPGGWTAFSPNPASGRFVSLRTVAVDSVGTTVKQTITRAYALTP